MRYGKDNLGITGVLLSIAVVLMHTFYLPFHPWTYGMVRPWFIINGLVPFRDFVWIRLPGDLYVLSAWYTMFGVSEQTYQALVATVLAATTCVVYLLGRRLFKTDSYWPPLFFSLIYSIFFLNTEIGELLIGLYAAATVLFAVTYTKDHKLRWLVCAGLLSGCMIVTKQNSLLLPTVCLLVLAVYTRQRNISAAKTLQNIFTYSAATLAAPILLVVYFASIGALQDLYFYTVSFLLFSYTKAPVTHGNGLVLAAGLLTMTIPLLAGTIRNKTILLLASIAALLPMLYPSFLSYRVYPLMPLLSVAAVFSIREIVKRTLLMKLTVLGSFAGACLILSPFIFDYQAFVSQNEVKSGQYIRDYGQNEEDIAGWILKNTDEDDRILVYANNIIYLLANRLPPHKFVDPFPYLLRPYDQTAPVFQNNAPSIFIYDTTLPDVHVGLEEVPFVAEISQKYTEAYTVDSTKIYTKKL